MNPSPGEILDLSVCYYFHARSFGENMKIYVILHPCIFYLNSSLATGPISPNMGKNPPVSLIKSADILSH